MGLREQSFRKIDLRPENSQYECPRLCEREHSPCLPSRRRPPATLNHSPRTPDFNSKPKPAESDPTHYNHTANHQQDRNVRGLHPNQAKSSGSVHKPVGNPSREENRSRKCRCKGSCQQKPGLGGGGETVDKVF